MKKKTLLKIATIAFVIIICGILITIFWLTTSTYKALPSAVEKADSNVSLTKTSAYYYFHNLPQNSSTTYAFIFYPGGLVEPDSYSKICTNIARNGFDCYIAILPLNLAVFNENAADSIINARSDIQYWIIGGHSLGGVMACRYLSAHTNKVTGLFLLASYCDIDISKTTSNVMSFVGSEDKVLNRTAYDNAKKNLPSSAKFVIVEGGNHSQFGDYGLQKGDGKASITTDVQIQSSVTEIIKILATNSQ